MNLELFQVPTPDEATEQPFEPGVRFVAIVLRSAIDGTKVWRELGVVSVRSEVEKRSFWFWRRKVVRHSTDTDAMWERIRGLREQARELLDDPEWQDVSVISGRVDEMATPTKPESVAFVADCCVRWENGRWA